MKKRMASTSKSRKAKRTQKIGIKKDWKLFSAVVVALAVVGTGTYFLRSNATSFDELAYTVRCNANHFLPDDPIVYPGQPGVSHMHMFFSNSSTNAATTTGSLQAGTGTCGRNMGPIDLSSYWVPALYKRNSDGSSTLYGSRNTFISAYYRRPGGNTGPKINPFPVGLRMIAGNAAATTPQSRSIVYWQCGAGGPQYDKVPTCTGSYANQPIRGDITFPSCWDGKNLDSANHQSHMAYANMSSGACPASHPVSLPQINFEIWFDGLYNGSSYFLASDRGPAGISLHGDFWNAWNNQAQNALVTACLNEDHACIGIERSDDGRNLFVPPGAPYPQFNITLASYSTTNPWDGKTVTPTFPTPPPPTHTTSDPTTPAAANAGHNGLASPSPTTTSPSPTPDTHSGHGTPSSSPETPATPSTTVYDTAETPKTIATTASKTKSYTGLTVIAVGVVVLAWALYRLAARRRGLPSKRTWN
jgi:hypothetical protein